MTIALEIKVSEMSDRGSSIKEMSKALGISEVTVKCYLTAKHRGMSLKQYRDELARRRGFTDNLEYNRHSWKIKGFDSLYQYTSWKDNNENRSRKIRTDRVMFVDPDQLNKIVDSSFKGSVHKEECRKRTLAEEINMFIEELPPNYKLVIRRSFYEGKNLESIGNELGVTHQAVSQLRRRALHKLHYKVLQAGINLD